MSDDSINKEQTACLACKFVAAASSTPPNMCGEMDEAEDSIPHWSLVVQTWDNGA